MPISLYRVMWQHLTHRPLQSILLVVGVMIGVAMMVAIDVANNSAARAFELSTDALIGKTTHEVSGGPNGVNEKIYTRIRTEIGWRNSAPIVNDYVTVLELDEQPFNLLGVDPFAEPPFRNYLSDGTLTTADNSDLFTLGRFLLQPNTVLIGQGLAETYDLQPNDTLTLQYGDKTVIVTIIGILNTDDALARSALQGVLIADIATAQEILGKQGSLTRIDLIIDEDTPEGRGVLRDIEAILPDGVTLRPARARSEAVSQLADAFALNLTALSLLALVVGIFLIYNTVMFSVVQRRTTLGILRSLGVTRRQIFVLVMLETAILGTVGAVLGLGLGIIMGRLALIAVSQTINDLFFTVTVQTLDVTALILIKGMVVGIGAALIAAFLPALEATSTPPASAMRRSELEHNARKILPYVTGLGIFAALLGGGMLLIEDLFFSFAGIFALVLGLALLTTLATIGLVHLLTPITAMLGGVTGRIAPRSILRNLSRTSIAITALMLAVSVIVGVTVMVGSFRITVQDWLLNTLQADIFISPPNTTAGQTTTPIDPALIDEVAAVDGVDRVVYTRLAYVQAADDERPVKLSAIMTDITNGRRKFIARVDGDEADLWQRVFEEDGLLLTESFAYHRGIEWREGLTYTLITNQGEYTFPVLGIYQDFTSSEGNVTIGLATYRRLWDDPMITGIGVYIENDADLAMVVQDIKTQLAGRQLVVQSNLDLRQDALEVFDRTFAITGALNLLATVVAFIGILSALMALQLERQREIGVMRSNGLTRFQLFKLTLWETGIMGTIAGVIAMPVGFILSLVLIYIINLRSFGWSLEMNLRPEFFLQAFAVAVIAALLAGLYPAWQIGRIQPVEALRSE
jgi:putative ABC transport system permease protein